MLIRKGDMVEVIAGEDRSRGGDRTVGRVLRVLRDEDKIVVEKVNVVDRHVRPNQRNPRGGKVSKEMPIHVSNVLLYNPQLGRGVRVGARVNENGEKVRVCKATGRELGVIRPAKQQEEPASSGE